MVADEPIRTGSRGLLLCVLALSLLAKVTDANPHATYTYVPFVVALYALPFWYASGLRRDLWTRRTGVWLAVQAVLTYVPFAVFGRHWVGGASGLLGGLVLLTVAARWRWPALAALVVLEAVVWHQVGLPYTPELDAEIWVLVAFTNASLSVFGLNLLADQLDALVATRRRLVSAAVARQRLAAGQHLQGRIVSRLAELTAHADEVVRTPDGDDMRSGLAGIGRIARVASADARRLVIELPDPATPEPSDEPDPTRGTPLLARGVAASVVVLFAVQYLNNAGVFAGEPRPGWRNSVVALTIAVAVVAIQVRHFGLVGGRRRPRGWPWTLALLAVLSFVLYPSNGVGSLVLLAFVAASGLILGDRWWRWVLFGVVVVAMPFLTLAHPGPEMVGVRAQLTWAVYAGATEAVAGLLLYGLYGFTQASRAVQAAHQRTVAAAATEEQLRLARDAHDTLGLGLSTIAMKSDLAAALLATDPSRARHEVVQISHLSAIVSSDAHAVSAGEVSFDLAGELATARSTLETAGIAVRVEADPDLVPAAVATALAAVLREAVTNVLRHSRARSCDIAIVARETGIRLEVRNDGCCQAAPRSTGLGLRNMAQRLEPFGGTLVTNRDGEVHRLTVDVPSRRSTAVAEEPVPVPR